jgi:hypothetical protein
MQSYIDRKIIPVPKEFICGLDYTYNNEILKLLRKKEKEYDKVLILTNAPQQIADFAASLFNTTVIHAPIDRKLKVLHEYCNYGSLFVCTDNKSDRDIMTASDNFIFLRKN